MCRHSCAMVCRSNFYFHFLFRLISFQIPPILDYPWKTDVLRRAQELMWLPDATLRNQTHKLVLDFFLLMCTCRQMLVFRIEKQYENSEFMGGSNKSVVDEINKLGSGEVPIETDDFVSIQKNWLDILKCIVFLGTFWVTLAIVFLAGSSHPNIYSIGYLVGSFIFLWQGGEFYLRPINTILRWWKFLVAYNVFVITAKALLHLPVCIFIDFLDTYWIGGSCFFQKTFGINCDFKTGVSILIMFLIKRLSNARIDCILLIATEGLRKS